MRLVRLLPPLLLLAALPTVSPLMAQGQAAPPGQVVGITIDKSTGRPLSGVDVSVSGTSFVTKADLNGRYRFASLAPGTYTLVARLIGFRPVRQDSVRVVAGQTVTINFAMEAAPVELQEVEVVAQEPAKTASAAGLLSIQQAAPSASDGISAEQLERAPDSDAGQAVARITGVSVVDQKYIVVRGLNERYNNTLLNGVEVASPEPLKRVVPLDIFQASLLESIVTTKSATPDRPGDFAGASVDIKTREFPDQFQAGMKVALEYNTQTTFEPTLVGPRTFADEFAFGVGRRLPDVAFPRTEVSTQGERFAENVRNVWAPTADAARPNVSLSGNAGGSVGGGESSRFGWVASLNYSNGVQRRQDRLYRVLDIAPPDLPPEPQPFRIDNRFTEGEVQVQWGGLANFAWRFGINNQLTFKNFYTRGSEEVYALVDAFSPAQPLQGLIWPMRYVERSAFQSQLGGQHRFGRGLMLEWRGSYSAATRDEPENRFLSANRGPDGSLIMNPNSVGFTQLTYRFLDERTLVAGLDATQPVSFWSPQDGIVKVGGQWRDRTRDFDGTRVTSQLNFSGADRNLLADAARRPPEEFWAPEYIGQAYGINQVQGQGNSYANDDVVVAGYGMVDVSVLPRLRLAGGVRLERWSLDLYLPGRPGAPPSPLLGGDSVPQSFIQTITRRETNWLPSANLTYRLSSQMNLRAAAFQSVARPDPRELSPELYLPIGGECPLRGNPSLQQTTIGNADAKWEWYPRPGEVIAVSGYYKRFTRPTVTIFSRSVSDGLCDLFFAQAREATVYGAELDLRRRLDFLPGVLGYLSVGGNLALVRSSAVLDSIAFGPNLTQEFTVPFAGQSDYLVNAQLGFDTPGGAVSATVLLNGFGNRVQNYGNFFFLSQGSAKDPDQIEQTRYTLDARMRIVVGRGTALNVAARNLTDNQVLVTQFDPSRGIDQVISSYRLGPSFAVGVEYAF